MDKQRFNKLCDEKNITIAELERTLSMSNGSLRGTGELRSDRLLALADFFHVSMDYLMGRDEELNLDRKPNNQEMLMLYMMSQLNEDGFNEALKRIEELTELSKYKKEHEND